MKKLASKLSYGLFCEKSKDKAMSEQSPSFIGLLEAVDLIHERIFHAPDPYTSQRILTFYEESWLTGEVMLGLKLDGIKDMMEF